MKPTRTQRAAHTSLSLLDRLRDGSSDDSARQTMYQAADEIERLNAWNRQMAEKAAAGGTLDGYRELGARVAAAESLADNLRAENERLREWIAYDIRCPCCQQIQTCSDGCTFSVDAPDDQAALDDYDRAIAQADAALGESNVE